MSEQKSADLSACGKYRYTLTRIWGPGPVVLFCGVNPSTADAFEDDATIRKERGFATRWGFGGFIKVNLLAWRSTDPKGVPQNFAAIGPHNREYIAGALHELSVKLVVAAWGDCLKDHPFAHATNGEDRWFLREAKRVGHFVECFGFTKLGRPKHPLMLPYDTKMLEVE